MRLTALLGLAVPPLLCLGIARCPGSGSPLPSVAAMVLLALLTFASLVAAVR